MIIWVALFFVSPDNYYCFGNDCDTINEKAIRKKYMRYMFTKENMLQSFD